jgi:hypothetical protein
MPRQLTDGPGGRFIESRGRWLYEIENVDKMPPFLMTVVGDTDLWMFLSSFGAFTAGRVEADRCLFPYETDDRLHEVGGIAGPVTMVRFVDGRLWQPLRARPDGTRISRVLRRSLVGDHVEFEETDEQSGLVFRVELGLSDTFGVVRRCELRVPSQGTPIECELIDGYVNVMPASVPLSLQQVMSTLVDGYKRSERVSEHGPAVYALEAMISDRPEAVEALRVNVIWHVGLDDATVSLSEDALRAFASGEPARAENLVLGRRGAYLCRSAVRLTPGGSERWCIVGDVHFDHGAVLDLEHKIRSGSAMGNEIDRSLEQDQERLERLLDGADGTQATADISACAAHRSNVLFNAMRGGIPLDEHAVDAESFRRFVHARHAAIGARHDAFLAGLVSPLSVETLPDVVRAAGCPQLVRLALEYLPLTFGRRHGDPSRPWNRFRIQVRDDRGGRLSAYEGNWRDIFQNWEAMCRSYPAMLPGVIAKFVNASTVDGYNPYRINERGIDWEVPEPENVRSNIGYWGDHQIVYLLRLLEQCRDTFPDWLQPMIEEPVFSYSNVPYRLRSFAEIAANPRSSIHFDAALNAKVSELGADIGGDGRLVLNDAREPVLVTLLEKLLVPALAKVANLVPGGGIWMNTQRPEWNDANNALAGYGLSMVTLYQLRGYCDFAADLTDDLGEGRTLLSPAVAAWCQQVVAVVARMLEATAGSGGADDHGRWRAIVELGSAAEVARESLYAHGPTQPVALERRIVADFFRCTRQLCDQLIRNAKQADGLYESYNVLSLGDSLAAVDRLGLMLEGQVAALSSSVLGADEACELLDVLFRSDLYRSDQRSFMLYPRVDLPRFMDRNVVSPSDIARSPLLRRALESPDAAIVSADADGTVRFCAELNSHETLARRLQALSLVAEWTDLVKADAEGVRRAFERTFRHSRFTGRSGTMHKYEGLGSIYWHMVSKLLLATQEAVFRAKDHGAEPDLISKLRAHYRAIRDGLGFRKTPAEFGAVPHEPYSHTPWNGGAQQPGMTGQVKEGVLARFGELGVRVRKGQIRFDPVLIDPSEFLKEACTMRVRGRLDRRIDVPAHAVGLTLCCTPIVVRLADRERVIVRTCAGSPVEFNGTELPRQWSREVFSRSGKVEMIEAEVRASP